MAAPFKLYNTLSRQLEPFTPLNDGAVKLYVCGMTVYDRCHVGHARAMVVFDTFVRYLRHRQWQVTFVRNFTDVDDKIIRRAAEIGEEPIALAQRFIQVFHDDADAMGLLRPDHEPRVSTSIDAIQNLVGRLIDNEHAYVAEGNVWFSVGTFGGYGKLSGQKFPSSTSCVAPMRPPANVTRQTSPCGRPRNLASHHGHRHGARAVLVGTSNARRWRNPLWVTRSTSMAAA